MVSGRDHRGPSVLVKPTAATDPAVTRALNDLRKSVDQRQNLLDGAVLIEDVVLTTTEWVRVKHSLRRRPRGYQVVRTKSVPSAAFSVYDDNENQTDAQQWLYLRSIGANVTIDLAVF